jgi:hypothetical protein
MITQDYNPSPLEVRFVQVLSELKDEINVKLANFEVYKIEHNTQLDNPTMEFFLKDKDGDEHQIVLKIIQKPDTLL